MENKSLTLTLAGWTQRHDALAPIAPGALHLEYYPSRSLEEVFALLKPYAKDIRYAIGWSLGGWLLMRAIMEGIIRPEHLVLIAPPLQFVSSPDFPYGMDTTTYELFYDNYRRDPERTAARFAHLIAKGDSHHKRIITELNLPAHTVDMEVWHPWLDILAEQQHNHLEFVDFPPTLLIHGEHDTIVPVAQGKELALRIPEAELHILPDASHAPHLHDAALLRRLINEHRQRHVDK